MKRASLKLSDSVEKREFSANIIAIDPMKIPEAKDKIRKFRRELSDFLSTSSSIEEVYCLSIQMFNLGEEKDGSNA